MGVARYGRLLVVQLRASFAQAAQYRVDFLLGAILGVAHATLRTRLCSARQPSIRAWSPDRSTSGTSQPRNSAGRV